MHWNSLQCIHCKTNVIYFHNMFVCYFHLLLLIFVVVAFVVVWFCLCLWNACKYSNAIVNSLFRLDLHANFSFRHFHTHSLTNTHSLTHTHKHLSAQQNGAPMQFPKFFILAIFPHCHLVQPLFATQAMQCVAFMLHSGWGFLVFTSKVHSVFGSI